MEKHELAKTLFMESQMSPHKISEHTGIPEEEVRELIYRGGWLEELNNTQMVTQKQFEEVSPILLSTAQAHALKTIVSRLSTIESDDLEIKDIKDLTSVLKDLDNINRLNLGKATTIVGGVELDRLDAKDIVGERRRRSDYIDAEYEEVSPHFSSEVE